MTLIIIMLLLRLSIS